MVIITFLIILLILITVHEFGHFIFAKIFNVYVSEFALGFGPKIFSYKGKETEFSVRILPLGGYAAMVGEDGEVSDDFKDLPKERTLKGVNRFKQFLIMFGGAFMNILLAIFIYFGIAATTDTVNPQPIIGAVTQNSPAYKAGLQANDFVYQAKLNQEITSIKSYTDLLLFTTSNKSGEKFELHVKRGNESKVIEIKPEYDKEQQRYVSGFSPSITKASNNPIAIVKNGWSLFVDSTRTMFISLGMLFNGKAGLDDLSGPVGMIKITGDISKSSGFSGLVGFAAMLSVNLAVLNLLPIPALDGGRILFLIIESITRRKINPKVESFLINISFILLMGLIILVTFGDILKIFR